MFHRVDVIEARDDIRGDRTLHKEPACFTEWT